MIAVKPDELGHYSQTNFTKLPNEFIDRRSFISKKTEDFYLYLCQKVNHSRFNVDGTPDTRSWQSYDTIMDECEFTDRTKLSKAIKELKTMGFIKVNLDYPPEVDKETGLIVKQHYQRTANSKKCNIYSIVLAGFPDRKDFTKKYKELRKGKVSTHLEILVRIRRLKDRKSPVAPGDTGVGRDDLRFSSSAISSSA